MMADVGWLMLLNEHESHGLNEFISPAERKEIAEIID